MPSISDPFSQRRSRAFITAASYALVCGMLMMATITIVQAMTVLAPGWQAGAWVWLSPLLALEALLSARQMRQYPALTPEWLAYRLAEWVTILLILRLVLYGVEGLDVLRADLSLPWREFASHFFSGAYWAWVVLGLLVWLVAGEFSASLEPLEVDEQAVEMERDAHAGPERQQARTRLAVLILSVGGVLLLAAALLRQDWVARLGNQPPLTAGAMNLVVYFVLGLLLLSLTRFSMLAMRWGINEYPVRTEVPQRWLAYGLLFLAVLGGIALLLPTAYAEGLLRVLAVVINFLAVVIAYLIYLISIPFLFLLNSLMHL
ncbi:MAG TPA: hypothetical protein VN363_06095, partial [Anaerolineales bacterium]|nr:hypothetical protein [Anaerolineales bacterium]